MSILCSLIEKVPYEEMDVSAVQIKKSTNNWAQAMEQVVSEAVGHSSEMTTLQDTLTPQFCVEWIACYAWFLYLTQSVWVSCSMIQGVIQKLTAAPKTL